MHRDISDELEAIKDGVTGCSCGVNKIRQMRVQWEVHVSISKKTKTGLFIFLSHLVPHIYFAFKAGRKMKEGNRLKDCEPHFLLVC